MSGSRRVSRVVEYRGQLWRVGPGTRTSDGFLIATGFLLDPDTGELAEDEDGFQICHQFFLGGE